MEASLTQKSFCVRCERRSEEQVGLREAAEIQCLWGRHRRCYLMFWWNGEKTLNIKNEVWAHNQLCSYRQCGLSDLFVCFSSFESFKFQWQLHQDPGRFEALRFSSRSWVSSKVFVKQEACLPDQSSSWRAFKSPPKYLEPTRPNPVCSTQAVNI